MKIADFFVKIGMKGSDETVKHARNVSSGMKEIASSGWQAKAMLVGAMYAFQQLGAHAMSMGKSMLHFSDSTGISSDRLQKWQYAAKLVGLSGESVMSSFKGVQNVMADIALGKGVPEGWGLFMDSVAPDPTRLRDTEYMMKKLQEFAQKMPVDIGSRFMQGLGINEETFVGMRRNAFTDDVFAKAPVMNDRQAKALRDMSIQFDLMKDKGERLVADLFSKHGPKFVTEISKILPEIFKLISAMATLAEKMKVFKVFGVVLEGWVDLLKLINNPEAGDEGTFKGVDMQTAWKNAQSPEAQKKGIIENFTDSFMKKPVNYASQDAKQVTDLKQTLIINTDARTAEDLAKDASNGYSNLYNSMNAKLRTQ